MLKVVFVTGMFPSAVLLSAVSALPIASAPTDAFPAGIFTGVFLLLIGFQLFLFLLLGDAAFLYAVFSTAPYGLFLLLDRGAFDAVPFPLQALCGGAALGGIVLLGRSLLGVRSYDAVWNRILLITAAASPPAFVLGEILLPAAMHGTAAAAAAAAILGGLFAASLRFSRRAGGGGPFLLAAVLSALAAHALPPLLPDLIRGNVPLTGFPFAASVRIIPVLLLSCAAGFRIRTVMRERERARRLAMDTLNDVDRLKADILAAITHALKPPLESIIGLVSSLMDRNGERSAGRVHDGLLMILSNARTLSSMVEKILDYSMLRNTNAFLDIRPLDVRRLVESALLPVRSRAAEKELSLELRIPDGLPPIMGDAARLKQVLSHLASNAVEFTREGEVTVWAERESDAVRIGVSDTGIGIPAEKHEAIFEPFVQVETAAASGTAGTGLGLTIARSLLEMHGSVFSVDSKPGRGSTFSFTLPAGGEGAGKPAVPEREEAESGDCAAAGEIVIKGVVGEAEVTILVVDDDPANLHVLAGVLATRDYSVLFARSGEEAFRMLDRGDRIDLIILEQKMPDMSGSAFCRRLRRTHSIDELPVLMVAAKNRSSSLGKGLGAGANDYLLKPFSREELFARIGIQLKIAGLHRSFTRFVPMEFLRNLGKLSIEEIRLGDNVRKEMTIMFADIRNFTELSETMSPEDNFRFLNAYLMRVGPVIRRYGGFIDKYIGDAVMAVFSGGVDHALQAAIEMQRVVADYNLIRISAGWNPISIGIGIHTGNLMLGTIGDEERLEGTVISDSVNTTSRIESLTKFFGTAILISERTFMMLDDPTHYEYRFLGKIQVKGRRQYVAIFDIFNGDPEDIVELKRRTQSEFERGVHLYFNREFTAAALLFRKVLAVHPTDKAASYYLQESIYYETNGAPDEWNGIFRTEHYLTV